MKQSQQKGREPTCMIFNDNVDPGASLMENQCLDLFIHHLINQKLPPFVVCEDDEQSNEMDQEVLKKKPQLSQISQKILTYNRKEKSLSELTKKFIEKFEGAKYNQLVIDQVSLEMKVQRRRIYDIINIMQSLNVVKKIRKNIYQWRGLIEALKTIQSYDGQDDQQMQLKTKCKRERSLQSLSVQFLRLFSKKKYNSKNEKEILTLQQASLIMMNDHQKDCKKTKVRRLYDIVNVFKCMGLVRKVKIEGCKPGYQWMGTRSLIKTIENKSSNFNIFRSQIESNEYLNQIFDEGVQQINAQKEEGIQNSEDNYSNQERKSNKIKKRSNSNKIQTQRQDEVHSFQQIRLKKSQSCSTTIKNNEKINQKSEIKYRDSKFCSSKSQREKNSSSPLTTVTKASNFTSDKSLKKINFFCEKNKKQLIIQHEKKNFQFSQFYSQKSQVQQNKQDGNCQYSPQAYSSSVNRIKRKVPKKLSKKSRQLEASESMLSSLLRGYTKIGLTTLDQFITTLKQNLYGGKSCKSIFHDEDFSTEKIKFEQTKFKKSFQRKRQSKSLQKQTKFKSLLSNEKVGLDEDIGKVGQNNLIY